MWRNKLPLLTFWLSENAGDDGEKKIGKMDASLQVDFISSCCTAPSQVSTEKGTTTAV